MKWVDNGSARANTPTEKIKEYDSTGIEPMTFCIYGRHLKLFGHQLPQIYRGVMFTVHNNTLDTDTSTGV